MGSCSAEEIGQISMLVVILLDDGDLANAYLSNVGRAIMDLCKRKHDMPIGAGMLPVQEICTCVGNSTKFDQSDTMENGPPKAICRIH